MAKLFPNYSGYIITSPFGMRVHPVTGKQTMHNGIDLVASNTGKSGQIDYILAHTGGTVEDAGFINSAGYSVNIRVDSKTLMVYYHMKGIPYVKKGESVKAGDKLGYMGSTGTATGAHLHWGIKKNGKWVDPKPYLDKDYPVTTVTNKKEELTVNIEMTVLTKGSKGEQVKTLQRLLLSLGYDPNGVDGSFGPGTDNAVRAFQKAKGLVVDGSVGKATWTKILKG